jgi:hypothetical protein
MDDELSKKLKQWQVQADSPRSFNAGVWQKIAARNEARQESAIGGLAEFFRMLMMSWRSATAVLLLALVLGTAAGGVEARGVNARRWSALRDRYADSINPVALASREENR